MKKKQIVAALAVCATAFSGLAVVACSDNTKPSKSYVVSYYANGGAFDNGSEVFYEQVKKGGNPLGQKTPENGDLDFLGWSLSSTSKTTVELSTYKVSKNTDFYAVWSNDDSGTYTVTFYNNYEGAPQDVFKTSKVQKGTPVAEPQPAPSRGQDYTFNGWYTAAKGGAKYVFTASVNKDLELYAYWTEGSQQPAELTEITVTGPTKTSYIAGQKLDLNGLKIMAHYSDGSSKEISGGYTTSPAHGATLTASDTSITVTYNKKTATIPITVSSRAVTKLDIEGELTNKTQYVGALLNTDGLKFKVNYNDGTSEYIDPSDVTFTSYALDKEGRLQTPGTAIKITANYGGRAPQFELAVQMPTAPLHDIIFDANNEAFKNYIENLPATRSVEEDKGTNKPDNPSLKGFTFDGWFKEAACKNAWIFSGENADKMGTENITLYAKWTAKTYNVTYTLAGDATDPVTNDENPTTYKATDGEIELKTPTREHYDFDGWYTVADAKVEKIDYSRITNITAADIKLTAKWTAKQYDITFELGGSASTYEVEWAKTKPEKYTYGTSRDLPDDSYLTITTKDGTEIPYNFIGWYLKGDPTQTIVETIAKGTSDEKTYVAKIEKAKTYKFTFVCGYDHHGDGTTTSSRNIVEGEKAIYRDLSELNRKGYTFGGWYNTVDCEDGDEYDFDTLVTAPKTIYAKWTPIEYTVDYVGDGIASNSLPVDYKITDDDTALTAPTLDTGYYFDGWYLDADFEGNAVTTLGEALIDKADGNNKITLYAKSSNKYAVVYNSNKPEGVTETTSNKPDDDEVVYGEKVVEQTGEDGKALVPDLTDYGFIGWYTDAACTVPWSFDTVVNSKVGISAENRTLNLYAKWYQKPTDGKYILGKFGDKNEWAEVLKGEHAIDYKAEVIRYATEQGKQVAKEWRVSGLTLQAGDEFKFVDYTKKDGVGWNDAYKNADTTTSESYHIRPGVMTVSLTTGDSPNYTIVSYSGSAEYTWSIEFGTNKDGKTYVTFTVDNYIGWRDPLTDNNENVPTKAEALEADHWYFAGNFTDWFDQTDAWSTKEAVKDGNRYYFTKVYLKQYDTFKIMNKSGTTQTWLGGKFDKLGTSFTLTTAGDNIELNTIEDGFYNIVFTNGTTKSMIITKYVEPTIEINEDNLVYEGDQITQDNLVVTANGSEVAAANYRILNTPITAVAGDNVIRIAYNGGIFEYTVNAIELEVKSITISKNPTKRWYFVGDTLNTAGMQVTLNYNKPGKTEVVTDLTKFDITATLVGKTEGELFAANTVAVTVALKENETITKTYDVYVVNKVTSVTATAPTKDDYFVDDKLNTAGMEVTVYFNGSETLSTAVTANYTTTPANGGKLSLGDDSITVTYTQVLPTGSSFSSVPTATCEVPITVKAPKITAIEIDGSLDKVNYTIGDTVFDPTGLEFTAIYENNTSKSINSSELTFSFGEYANADGMFIKKGTATVTVKYGDDIVATSDETITVTVANKLTSIVADASGIVKPHDAGFVEGDMLTATALNGIVVKAIYNEGYETAGATVEDAVLERGGTNGYTVSPAIGTELEAGDTEVTVSYKGKTDKFTVTAVARAMTKLTVSGTPAEQYLGSKVNTTGLTFMAHFNDDTEEPVAPANIKFTCPALNDDGNFAVDGEGKVVTATYNDEECTFIVEVKNITKYLVHFDVNIPGTGKVANGMPSDQTITHGDPVDEPAANPTLKGYTFGGWYKEAACTTAWNFSEGVTGNKTIYAKWNSKTYTIIYSVDGLTNVLTNGSYSATANVYPEQGLEKPAAKTGHEFVGWCFDLNDEEETPFKRMTYARIPAGDSTIIQLYAKYELKEYSVTFDLRGGTAGEEFKEQTVKYNNTATAPTETPTRKHWDFLMWYVGDYVEGTTTAYNFDTPITDDLVIYARWKGIDYTVKYNLDGGENGAGNPATFSFPDDDVDLAEATKEGYKFTGWLYNGKKVDKITNDMLPNSKTDVIELTATFEKVVYHTVTFNLNYEGAAAATTAKVEDGKPATRPTPNPTRRGWKFEGWYTNEAGTGDAYTFTAALDGDLPLYAWWTQNTVKVTFNYNYGTTPTVKEETIFQYATAASVKPADPKRTGYDFKGWYDNKDGNGAAYAFTEEVGTALTLYAKWEKITGSYVVIGTDKRPMTDNSLQSDFHEVEYMLVDIELHAGDTVSFTVDGVAVNVTVDGGAHGITETGIQSSLTISDDGTYSFYLYKVNSADTGWTIYATYAEYVQDDGYFLVGDFYGNSSYKWASINPAFALKGNKIEDVELKANDQIKLAKQGNGTAILWDGTELGSAAVTVGKNYLKTGENLIFKYNGTYTIKLVGGKIEITGKDVEIPDDPTYEKDGLYIGNKLIQEFATHQGNEVKLMAVQIPKNSKLTFVYDSEVVVPTIKSDCPAKSRFTNWTCAAGGIFNMYYDFGTNQIWIEYQGEYTAPAEDLGGLAIDGTIAYAFVLNADGANEVWTGATQITLAAQTQFTLQYDGAAVTNFTLKEGSIGKIESGKLVLPKGKFKIAYNYASNWVHVSGTVELEGTDKITADANSIVIKYSDGWVKITLKNTDGKTNPFLHIWNSDGDHTGGWGKGTLNKTFTVESSVSSSKTLIVGYNGGQAADFALPTFEHGMHITIELKGNKCSVVSTVNLVNSNT